MHMSPLVPSDFIGLFNATQYAFDVNIYYSTGTIVFVAQYIISPNVTQLEYLSFDVRLVNDDDEMMLGEAETVGEGYLINGEPPPLNVPVQNLSQSENMLMIVFNLPLQSYEEITSFTFDLLSNISTANGLTAMPSANLLVNIVGKLLLCINL